MHWLWTCLDLGLIYNMWICDSDMFIKWIAYKTVYK